MGANCLMDKHGQVLSDRVAKVRPEYSDVETAAVADTHNRLRTQLVRDTHSRPECADVVSNIAVQAVRAETAHPDDALVDVCKTSVALGIHGFGQIVLPPDAIGDRQFAAHSELVLGVDEKALLTFRSRLANTGEALEMGNITQEERRQIQPSCVA